MTACKKKLTDANGKVEDLIYVKNGKAKMPVRLYGDLDRNTIIIIVHGGPGGSGLDYRTGKYVEELEKRYVLAYWDQRGQGMSEGRGGNMTVPLMAEDLLHVVKTIKNKYGSDKKIVLLGHSWGGALGTQFMVTPGYQNEIDGWIEADGAHDIPLLNKLAVSMFAQVAQEQIDTGNSLEFWQETLDWANGIDTNNISYDDGGAINSKGYEAEETLLADAVLYGSERVDYGSYRPMNVITSSLSGAVTSNAIYQEVESLALTDQLYRITKPCLFIYGKYDFVCPPELGLSALSRVSSAQKKFVLFEFSGHSTMDNEPMKFVRTVEEFVEGL